MDEGTVAQTPPQDTAKRPPRDLEFRLQARAIIQEAVEAALERLTELHEARRSGGPVQLDQPTGDHLLQPKAAARLLGFSDRRFYEVKRHSDFPSPVLLPGIDAPARYYRRSDLEAWVASLAPARGAGTTR